jgi:lipoprotein-anchoring transpeptidase ErfK/SrfK
MTVDVSKKPLPWMDTVLLSGIVTASVAACAVLALMAWQAPGVVRTLHQPTTTPFALPPAAIAALHTPAPNPTDALVTTHTPSPPPRATITRATSPTATSIPQDQATPVAPRDKWIVIDVSKQTLTAYEWETPVLSAAVSTGKPYTPTPLGEFAIYARVPVQDMKGPGYLLRDVRYIAYFAGEYAIHATYWHDNFGQPMSHGCVNMRTADARWLYEWAPIGTLVRVHD